MGKRTQRESKARDLSLVGSSSSRRGLTGQLDVFVFLRGRHGVVKDLRRADDHVGILHHPAEEVLPLAVPADGHQVVVTAQVRLELIAVMLLYKVDLPNNSNSINFTWPVSC